MPARRCGAIDQGSDAVRWRLWAPRLKQADLVLLGDQGAREIIPMARESDGEHFAVDRPGVTEGQLYVYRLDGGDERPDPCSLSQPCGINGPSAVIRPARFGRAGLNWKGIKRADLVVYELHVGTFTPAGTFEAVIPRLKELAELGITAVEIMPVGQFPGSRNWGYDGAMAYAAQNTYGGPAALANLVDACHAHGLAAILDVVYNHAGPEGNYLPLYGPYFTDKYKTPWGAAFNFDDRGSDAVRCYVLDNVRMWLEEFGFDGLRLDAVHAIFDMGARHILAAIREVADEVWRKQGRTIHIIAESDLNDPRIVSPAERGGYGLDAQWADDFHHAVHAWLTGEQRGYYCDYGKAEDIAQAMRTPFIYAGTYSRSRGRTHGAAAGDLSGDHFVVCIQNHDQIGNRARGERLGALVDNPAKLRLAASLLLLSPYIPLIFMGEEYAERRPFPFFSSFLSADLRAAVAEGRAQEFPELLGHPDGMMDPNDESTFRAAVLSWRWPDGSTHAAMRRLYADLIRLRSTEPGLRAKRRRVELENNLLTLTRGRSRAVFNLCGKSKPLAAEGNIIFRSESPQYGGSAKRRRSLAAWECVLVRL